MQRREFLRRAGLVAGGGLGATAGASLVGAAAAPQTPRLRWARASGSALFANVTCDGVPGVVSSAAALLEGQCRLWGEAPTQASRLGVGQAVTRHGPIRAELRHQLHDSGTGHGEDLLQAVLTLHNMSDEPQAVEVAFLSSAQPVPGSREQHLYLPLSAAGLNQDKRFAALGMSEFVRDCRQVVTKGTFACHYLEPEASIPDQRTTRALLLAPVVDVRQAGSPWHLALFTPSDEPVCFHSAEWPEGRRCWRAVRVVTLRPAETFTARCWLLLHTGEASVAWQAFHRFAHRQEHPPIEWIRDFRVHYYDFLSSAAGKNGHRGDGYDAAITFFRAFHVGLATQHGYYPGMGDHLHPDRPRWLAMQGDKQGPVEMSFETIRSRIQATRAAGAKAAIYMHLTALDDSSDVFYPALASARRMAADGRPIKYGWNGPDVKGQLWWMSVAGSAWRRHLLQQAAWIMEILQPDAICMDETFCGIGYDETPGRRGPISPHAIPFFRELHALVRSFGPDKALFTSDCSMAPFVMWADGEVGDHAYPGLLGQSLYRQEPVRYLAALGDKPWRACAWHFQHMWEHQMVLARQVGAGVGVSNGWLEYTGLHGLSEAQRRRLIADINTLV